MFVQHEDRAMASELDVFKDIPGYKAILKSILKSQIQLLVNTKFALSFHTIKHTLIMFFTFPHLWI